MKQLLLQTGCDPFISGELPVLNASKPGSLLGAITRGCILLKNASLPLYIDIVDNDKKKSAETDSGAVFYIVFVLVFYSAGIVIMIIKYLRREKRELDDEKALEDFFRSMPAYKKEREQFTVNQVAIHAFHALTSLSYGGIDNDDNDDVTSDDEHIRTLAPTIHEHQEDSDDEAETEETVSDNKEIDLYQPGVKEDSITIDSSDLV